ncbi:tagaturonate reductase [Arthrobacter globiformis]|uniref:tagaturonate reductase n=1 Tax=Arthrobacter globiformis TaxID=1665 RepID=UPI00278FFD40|nr:tagaturonate reductase [Arthrobacter globiformis]MDQ0617397.1 tagaturonate reductase [Arthrobacter globiformis]
MKKLDATTTARPELPITIMQFGAGNFLRAFVDWMITRANQSGVTRDGVAVIQATDRPSQALRQLAEQDGLFHVYLEGIKDRRPVKEVDLVTCVRSVLSAHNQFEEYDRLVISPDLRVIVSNTTEAGIEFVSGDDLSARPPRSFPAKVTALLYRRFEHFRGDPEAGLSFLCCELIEDNGSTLREHVLHHAADNDLGAEFDAWVRTACHFYDTLVDRIVPGFPQGEIEAVQAEIGFADELVVKAEHFYVWAIGGSPAIREVLPLDRAGLNVLFMDDIRPFRAKKVRILNGAHTAMSAIALQLGCETVRDAFAVPLVEALINRLVADEVLPTIEGDRQALEAFAQQILERFYNPSLRHQLEDIALNALSKWATRNLPVVLDRWAVDAQAPLTVLSLAALLVLYSGRSENSQLEPRDDARIVQLLRSTFDREDLPGWIAGVINCLPLPATMDAAAISRLSTETSRAAELILERGMAGALQELLA